MRILCARFLLPYVPFAMAASTYARRFTLSPLLFFVCRLVGWWQVRSRCPPALHAALASNAAAPLRWPWQVFFLFGAAWRPRVPGVICITRAWQPTAVFRLKVLQAKGIEAIKKLFFDDLTVANVQIKGRRAKGIMH